MLWGWRHIRAHGGTADENMLQQVPGVGLRLDLLDTRAEIPWEPGMPPPSAASSED